MAENKSVAGAKKSTAKGKKRAKRSVPLGQAHIQATFNNTINEEIGRASCRERV